MKPTANLEESLAKLVARYGDRAANYIEGLAIRSEMTYDDYINVETLLTLQHPLTNYHDELTFLMYHQQTELWFRLALHELEHGIEALLQEPADIATAIESASRTNRIIKFITQSFDVLIYGLDTDAFMEFRKAFGSTSGFQSAQFRAIEILAGLERHNKESKDHTFYWERAARDITTGEPTLTLTKFKEKHLHWLNEMYEKRKPYSFRLAFEQVLRQRVSKPDLRSLYQTLFNGEAPLELQTLANELVILDSEIIAWKGSHLRAAAKHLAKSPKGTGETNWAEYLSRSLKEEHYFPELVMAMKEASVEEELEMPTLGDA